MIGLRRGTVRLAPSHKGWPVEFEKEKRRFQKVLGDRIVDIQHIGSTSVPGLTAKPIIDISIGVTRFKDAQKLLRPMSKLGYKFYRKFGRQILFAKGPEAKRTHYLHVMRYGGAKWTTDMLFRDYLRTHVRRAREYELLKKELATQYPNDRKRYTDGKNSFIKYTLGLANRKRRLKASR